MAERKNVILDKSFEFALGVIEFCEELESNRKYVIARQMLRSGTSIGANIREAQCCESKKDFIHKLKISAKEAQDTEYWLLLCKQSKSYPESENLLAQIVEIQKLLSSIISSAKRGVMG